MAETGPREGDGEAEAGKTDFAVKLSLDLLREKHSSISWQVCPADICEHKVGLRVAGGPQAGGKKILSRPKHSPIEKKTDLILN